MIYFLFIYCIDYRRPTGYIPTEKLEGGIPSGKLEGEVYLLENWRGRGYTHWKTGHSRVGILLENWSWSEGSHFPGSRQDFVVERGWNLGTVDVISSDL